MTSPINIRQFPTSTWFFVEEPVCEDGDDMGQQIRPTMTVKFRYGEQLALRSKDDDQKEEFLSKSRSLTYRVLDCMERVLAYPKLPSQSLWNDKSVNMGESAASIYEFIAYKNLPGMFEQCMVKEGVPFKRGFVGTNEELHTTYRYSSEGF